MVHTSRHIILNRFNASDAWTTFICISRVISRCNIKIVGHSICCECDLVCIRQTRKSTKIRVKNTSSILLGQPDKLAVVEHRLNHNQHILLQHIRILSTSHHSMYWFISAAWTGRMVWFWVDLVNLSFTPPQIVRGLPKMVKMLMVLFRMSTHALLPHVPPLILLMPSVLQ